MRSEPQSGECRNNTYPVGMPVKTIRRGASLEKIDRLKISDNLNAGVNANLTVRQIT